MSIGEYWTVIRRRWIPIFVLTVLGVGIASVFTAATPRLYTSTATNFVALTASGSGDQNPLAGAQFAAQRVKSYTEIVGSPDVLMPVIDEMNLAMTPQQLSSKVSVSNPPQTVLLLVSATDGSPEQAARLANAVSIQLGRVIESLETPTGQSVPPVKVTLTEPAIPAGSPSAPKRTLNLALGLMIGLACGLTWAFLRESLDRTIKSIQQLEVATDVPLLGQVPFDKGAVRNRLAALESTSPRSEGYRTIRANLQFMNVDHPVRAIVITSANPGDGKTTVACNLAIAMAQSGKSVCLVEADLRRPRITEYLGTTAAVGLTDVLSNQRTLDEVLLPWNRGLLTVLPPGQMPPNPSELLESSQMQALIKKLKERFEMVVIDSSPLLAVADAAVVARYADGAILVVRHGVSTRDGVAHALSGLSQNDEIALGTVLNAVPHRRSYGYGYGYGYGDSKIEAAPAPSVPESSSVPFGTGRTGA